MMQHLKRLIHWFTNGVALALGVAAVVWVTSRFGEEPQTVLNVPRYAADSVQLSGVEAIPFAEVLTVAAVLNSADKANVAVHLELVVMNDGKVVYTCPLQSVTYRDAGQPQRVQVECRNLRRASLPEGATVALHVREVAWLPT